MKRSFFIIAVFLAGLALAVSTAKAVTRTWDGSVAPNDISNNPVWTMPLADGTPNSGYTQGAGIGTIWTADKPEDTGSGQNTSSRLYRITGGNGTYWCHNDSSNSIIKFRVKVNSVTAEGTYATGIGFGVPGDKYWTLLFDSGQVKASSGGSVTIDMATFQIFTVVIFADGSKAELYINNATTAAMTWTGSVNSANRIDLGDWRADVGGSADWDYIYWTNDSEWDGSNEPGKNLSLDPNGINLPQWNWAIADGGDNSNYIDNGDGTGTINTTAHDSSPATFGYRRLYRMQTGLEGTTGASWNHTSAGYSVIEFRAKVDSVLSSHDYAGELAISADTTTGGNYRLRRLKFATDHVKAHYGASTDFFDATAYNDYKIIIEPGEDLAHLYINGIFAMSWSGTNVTGDTERIDLGDSDNLAGEGRVGGSMTWDYLKWANDTCPFDLIGDYDGDCDVDIVDFAAFSDNWLVDCLADDSDPGCVVN